MALGVVQVDAVQVGGDFARWSGRRRIPFGGLWSPRTGAIVVVFRKGHASADNRDVHHDPRVVPQRKLTVVAVLPPKSGAERFGVLDLIVTGNAALTCLAASSSIRTPEALTAVLRSVSAGVTVPPADLDSPVLDGLQDSRGRFDDRWPWYSPG